MPKKGFRVPACFGGSKTTGEAEMASSPGSPAGTDKIKAIKAQQPASPAHKVMQQQQNDAAGKLPFSTANGPAQPAAVAVTGSPKIPWPMSKFTGPSPADTKEVATPSKAVAQPAAVPPSKTFFSSTPLLGGGGTAGAAAGTQVTTGDQVAKFARRMGNIVANSMAGGFGATLGSRAAHSVWNGVTRRH